MNPVRWKRELLLGCVVVLVLAGLLGLRLFPEPVIGIADNGDFDRLLCPVGLGHPPELEWAHKYFYWIHRTYEVGAAGENCMRYASSESLFVRAALYLSRDVFGREDSFDIRVIGMLHCTVYVLAFLLIMLSTRSWQLSTRALLFYVLTLVLADIGYVVYMNSFFCEPATLLFFMTLAGFFLLLASIPEGEEEKSASGLAVSALLLAGFVAGSLFWAASKPQNYMLGVTCLLPCAWLLITRKETLLKVIAATGLILIPVYAGSLFSKVDREFTRMQLYDIVFKDVVAHSPAPEQDLEELGLPTEFKVYLGTSAWQEGSPYADPEFREQFRTVSYGSVAKLYLRHPGRYFDDLRRSARQALDVRIQGMFGHYEPASGMPAHAQSSSFSLWSQFRENVFPRRLWFLLLFGFANLGVIAGKRLGFDRSRFDRGITVLHLWVLATGALAFLTVTAGGGSFATRHMFLVNLSFDVCCIFLVMYLVGWLTHRTARGPPTPEPAP